MRGVSLVGVSQSEVGLTVTVTVTVTHIGTCSSPVSHHVPMPVMRVLSSEALISRMRFVDNQSSYSLLLTPYSLLLTSYFLLLTSYFLSRAEEQHRLFGRRGPLHVYAHDL